MIKRLNYENKVVAKPNNRTDSSKKPVFLDRIIRVSNQADTRTENKIDVKTLNKANFRDDNKINVIIRQDSENKVVGEIKNKLDIKVFSRLKLLIYKDEYARNFPFCNFANILANFFYNLLPTLIDFNSFPTFFLFFSYFITFNCTNSFKLLDFTSLGGLTTCNFSNIYAFYHQLFAYLTIVLTPIFLIFFLIQLK